MVFKALISLSGKLYKENSYFKNAVPITTKSFRLHHNKPNFKPKFDTGDWIPKTIFVYRMSLNLFWPSKFVI